MFAFDPPELLEQLRIAHKNLGDYLTVEDYDLSFDDIDSDAPDDLEEIITPETVLESVYGFDSDDYLRLTIGEYLEYSELLRASIKIENRSVLRLGKRTLFHLAPICNASFAYVYDHPRPSIKTGQQAVFLGSTLSIRLIDGLTPFALLIAAEGLNDDHFPSYSEEDTFIEITHPADIPSEVIDSFAKNYLFELASSYSLVFEISPYLYADSEWDFQDVTGEAAFPDGNFRLPPMNISDPLPELHGTFLKGMSASDDEIALLFFVKVLEFISATVIRMQAHAAIRKRLAFNKAMAPDAQYIEELLTLIENQRVLKKDSEALKQTILTCCDAAELAPQAIFLKQCKLYCSGNEQADNWKRTVEVGEKSLTEISACISATRNQIVHAKANYTLTGEECPKEHLAQLKECVRIAAVQAIRWYSSQPEEARVK